MATWFESQRAPAWRRITAYLVDCLLIDLYLLAFSAILRTAEALGVPLWPEAGSPVLGQLLLIVVLTWPAMFYLALTEASRWQATAGKRLLGLRVDAIDGGRPRLAQTLLRAFLKLFVPWELAHFVVHRAGAGITASLDAGFDLDAAFDLLEITPLDQGVLWVMFAILGVYVLGLFTPTGRTLYDRASGTRVATSAPAKNTSATTKPTPPTGQN